MRHLEVINNIQYVNVSKVFNSEEKVLIGWCNQLRRATATDTCNVMVMKHKNKIKMAVNWRVSGVDETELFGRILTEDENRFFI